MQHLAEPNSIVTKQINKVFKGQSLSKEDSLVTEEPLEISVSYSEQENYKQSPISITMRTPGDDKHLALGFLFTEGIIYSNEDIEEINAIEENKIDVKLNSNVKVDIGKLSRHLFTSSSCGVCGKTSIDNLKTVIPENILDKKLEVSSDVLYSLGEKLRAKQSLFESTGGIHAAASFSTAGKLEMMAEDVGRHNAVDKLIGKHLVGNFCPMNNNILLVSGRASFELVQKALMAGIPMMCAIGSPSSMAVELAVRHWFSFEYGSRTGGRIWNDINRFFKA